MEWDPTEVPAVKRGVGTRLSSAAQFAIRSHWSSGLYPGTWRQGNEAWNLGDLIGMMRWGGNQGDVCTHLVQPCSTSELLSTLGRLVWTGETPARDALNAGPAMRTGQNRRVALGSGTTGTWGHLDGRSPTRTEAD